MANPCLGASGKADPLDSRETNEPVAMAMERKMKPHTERCQPTRSIKSKEGRRANNLPGCFDFSCFSLARYKSDKANASTSAAVPAAADPTWSASADEWVSAGAMARVPECTRCAGTITATVTGATNAPPRQS